MLTLSLPRIKPLSRAIWGSFLVTHRPNFPLAATVTPTGPFAVTGNVAFKSGTTTLGTVALSGGTASYSSSTLTVGAKSIAAVYSGDSNNASSTSPILTQTVSKATTAVVLMSTPNPSIFGQAVVFTATVTSATGVTPSGNVTFRRGTVTLGTVTLNTSGVANLTISTLPRGNDTITASYNGITNFATSSGSLVQVVN